MLQQILNGLSIGSVYAVLAAGFSLIYSILGFPHFAHGITMMIASYSGYEVGVITGSFPLAIIAAVIGGALSSVAMEAFGYRRLRKKNVPKIYYLALSMSICTFAENLMLNTIGSAYNSYPRFIPATSIIIPVLDVAVSIMDMVALLIAVTLLVIINLIIKRTSRGLAIRASSNNIEATELMGANLNSIMIFVFMIAGASAGFAGIILGMKYTVYPQMWTITNKVLIATILGGLGSMSGSIIASLMVGLIEVFVTAYISSEMSTLVVFVLLIVILIFRPQGLFGRIIEDKA